MSTTDVTADVAPLPDRRAGDSPGGYALRAGVVGVLAVLAASVVGVLLAWVLGLLGLTSTGVLRLGAWLAGTGLLGGWRQSVEATVAGGVSWSTVAVGAPLLVTGAVILTVAVAARGVALPAGVGGGAGAVLGAVGAAVGAGIGAAVLTVASQYTQVAENPAGSVTTAEGLTWWWSTGTHPGTVIGAALLVGVTWWVNTAGLSWWREGRAVAYGVLVVPGVLLTLATAAGLVFLTSSWAVGAAALVLFPLLGSVLVLGLGGAPVQAGLTRISPEPWTLDTWSEGLLVGAGGLVVVVLLAALTGWVLRARRHQGGWVAMITVPAIVAGFVAWATSATVLPPDSLGGATEVAVSPWVAVLVGAGTGIVARVVRGRPRPLSHDNAE